MKDIISDILDIENKANGIIEDGRKERARMLTKMKEDIVKMQRDIFAMIEHKLEQLDEEERVSAEISLKRINESADKRLAAMDGFYKENRDAWVRAVFEIVTGSEPGGP